MGREIKRVARDFDWPIDKVWSGYLMPDTLSEEDCQYCGATGSSPQARALNDRWYGHVPFHPAETGSAVLTAETPAVRAFAERNVARSPEFYGTGEDAIVGEADRLAKMWNGQWSHHLDQADVDALVEAGRLHDFTHTWAKGDGWQPIIPAPTVLARDVNTWSLSGLAHDAINRHVVVTAKCARDGIDPTCSACGGRGSTEKYEGQRAEAEAWTATEPPSGDGWQLWSTTTEGHPMSPVFATGEELAWWMSQNDCGFARTRPTYEGALAFVKAGWAPSMIATPETGLIDGVTYAGRDAVPGDVLELAAALAEGGAA